MKLLELKFSGIETQAAGNGEALETLIQNHILTRSWFSRVWILQELVLSVSPWIQGGPYRIKWDAFSKYVRTSDSALWSSHSRDLLTGMDKTRRSFRTRSVEIEIAPSKASSLVPLTDLFQIMEARRGSGVSDARDMIFAHLGLTSDTTKNEIPIDYSQSTEQLYEDIARKHIEAHGNTSIIYHVETADLSKRRKGLPSWVPDWGVVGPIGSDTAGLGQEISEGIQKGHYQLHTQPQAYCIGCMKPVPGVLGLVGWDLGPIASIIPSSELPVLIRVGKSMNVDHWRVEEFVRKWIGDTKASMPNLVLSVLRHYREAMQTGWARLQALDSQDPTFSSGSFPSRYFYSGLNPLLWGVVTAWFPFEVERSIIGKVSGYRNNKQIYLEQLRDFVMPMLTSHIFDCLKQLVLCHASGQQPAVLASGHYACVPALACAGHHVFRVFDDDRLFLLEPQQPAQASKADLSTYLKACGKGLVDYHLYYCNKQTPIKSFKFVASNKSFEVYDENIADVFNKRDKHLSGETEGDERALVLISLH